MNTFNDLTLIIVCYKSFSLIKKNINNLKNFKTIIIDNSNCYKTYNLVKEYRNIKYIKTVKNLGYGAANNIAVRNSETKYVLILNPDIVIDNTSIQILFENVKKYENIGILAPSLYDQNNLRRTNGSRSILKYKGIRSVKSNFAVGDTCYDYIIGCAILIEKQFFLNIGCFDETFFMYFEDNDLCDRVHLHKRSVIEIPKSKMTHMQGLSSKLNFIFKIKLSVIHKVSECLYLKKNLSKSKLFFRLTKNFLDYFQRSFFNIIIFKPKKSFKNILRMLSIILFVTNFYKLLY